MGKANARRTLLSATSSKQMSAYVYADAGMGESTTDLVYGGHDMIYENGSLLAEGKPFSGDAAISEIDVQRLSSLRAKRNPFNCTESAKFINSFALTMEETTLTRKISDSPFVPKAEAQRLARAEEIVTMQSAALARRLSHIGCSAVIGISGGLDSTLALLVTVVLAKVVGAILPMVAKVVRLDPAVMASPFITTIVDAMSLLIYFRVAMIVLGITV